MDQITSAIVAVLAAGALSGLTEASKAAITDAYTRLKELLATKFGGSSEVIKAVEHLEIKPKSVGRKNLLQEEMVAAGAGQDEELLAAAKQVLALVQPQLASPGTFAIQNNAPVQGQNIATSQHIEQHFSNPTGAENLPGDR